MRVMKQVRRCGVCASTKHRVETCPRPAAKLVRSLRAKVIQLTMKKMTRKPKRKSPKSTGRYAKKAMKMYTKDPDAKGQKGKRNTRGRCPPDHGGAENPTILDLTVSPVGALAIMQKKRFYEELVSCPGCSAKLGLPKPRPDKADGHLYYRCTCNGCVYHDARINVGQYSFHHGSCKMTLRQIGFVVGSYSNYECMPPSASDLASTLKVGAKTVQGLIGKLRHVEAELGRKGNSVGKLKGDIEVDEHCLRTFYVSATNPHFQHLIPKRLRAAGHAYYIVHFRVIGARKRGGTKLYLALLPFKPLAPGSRPPPLDNPELISSGILRVLQAGSTVLYTDGAHAYPSVLKSHFPNIIGKSVSHANMEFTKKVPWFKAGHSTLAGTQCIDSTWGALDKFLPNTLKTKGADRNVNPMVMEYIWAGVQRMNHKDSDGLSLLGAGCV
jgi:hypothetical protein